MSHLRLNLLNGRWVTLVAHRAERPTDFAPRSEANGLDAVQPCPFCPDQQRGIPAVLERTDEHGQWRQRLIANRYPAFDGEELFAVHHHGPVHIEADASGIHEVFILSPDHHGRPEGDSYADSVGAMQMLRERFAQLAETPNLRYTQAIINHGREAGASMSHPHGQLLGLPFVPGEILDEQRAFTRFEGGCVLCATLEAEVASGLRVVFENDQAVVVCPYWSGSPYEMLVIPRDHDEHLTAATSASIDGMASALQDALIALQSQHGDVAFNAVLHTAPHHYSGAFHWHIHLYPSMVSTAGFERGTGVMINIVSPEVAAANLRQAFVH